MKSVGSLVSVLCVERHWGYKMRKSKMDVICEKEVSVTLPIAAWVLVQSAMSNYDTRRVDPRLLDETMVERAGILKALGVMLDEEFPLA